LNQGSNPTLGSGGT